MGRSVWYRGTIVGVMLVLATALVCEPSESPCPRTEAQCAVGTEVFTSPRSRESGPRSRPVKPWLQVEYDGCTHVMEGVGAEVECIYEPGGTLMLWVEHTLETEPPIGVVGPGKWTLAEPITREDEFGRGRRVHLEGTTLTEVVVGEGENAWRLRLRSTTELTKEEREARESTRKRWTPLETRLSKERDAAAIDEAEILARDVAKQGFLSDAVRIALATSYHAEIMGQRDRAETLIKGMLPAARRFPWGAAAAEIYLGNVQHAEGRSSKAARHYRDGGRFVVKMADINLQLDALPRYAMALTELGYYEAAAYWANEALEVIAREARPVDRAMALDLTARVGLRLLRANRLHEDPGPLFEKVLQMYSSEGPLASLREPASRLGLAELALHRGDSEGARRWLDSVELDRLRIDQSVWARELYLRSLLDGDETSASLHEELRSALDELDELAAQVPGPESRWRVDLARGRVHERLGNRAEARAAYERGEHWLDQVLSSMAQGVPGGFAVAEGSEGTGRLIALLVADGQLDAAVCVARQSRARAARAGLARHQSDSSGEAHGKALRERYERHRGDYERRLQWEASLSARDRTRARVETERIRRELESTEEELLSLVGDRANRPRCDELSPRLPGELLLIIVPHLDALRVFVVDDEGVTHTLLEGYAHRAEELDPHWLTDLLLAPTRDRIQAASRVRVLASGRATAIPVHALPWPREGSTESMLGLEVPVVYGLELPAGEPKPAAGPRRALLLADDWADGADEEIEDARELLRARGWSVWSDPAGAWSRIDLLHELESVQLFHYAGHAYFAEVATDVTRRLEYDDRTRRWPPYSGGAAAVPSFIPLREHERLKVPDILTAQRVPDTVVLMGCATGATEERRAHGGFSLATAFVAAGSRAAVASTRQVAGREAAILGGALYSAISAETQQEPGLWMSKGLRVALERGLPARAVEDYRVYVP